jgi:hypothetical protein
LQCLEITFAINIISSSIQLFWKELLVFKDAWENVGRLNVVFVFAFWQQWLHYCTKNGEPS